MKKVLCLVLLVLLAVLVSGCGDGDQVRDGGDNIPVTGGLKDVTWHEIPAPPGVEGPCWAYFIEEGSGNYSVGYSGVYCMPNPE